MKAKRFGRSRRAATACGLLLVALMTGSSRAGTGDDCPPNPEPGKCYEKVFRPAQYESYVDQQAGDRIVTRQRKIREASFAWQVIPCDGRMPPRRSY